MKLSQLFLQCLIMPYSQVGNSSNYALVRKKDILYIYFQKSVGLRDWIVNFNFPVRPYKKMDDSIWSGHKGFIKEWKIIEPKLRKDILNPQLNKIIITGYSHGAAIALLCHEYVWYHRPDLRETLFGYGFGCPRVFWGIKDKVSDRWKNFLIIRNGEDIVTHLPPLFLGFSHVGKMLSLKNKINIFLNHSPQRILKELLLFEENIVLIKFIYDFLNKKG